MIVTFTGTYFDGTQPAQGDVQIPRVPLSIPYQTDVLLRLFLNRGNGSPFLIPGTASGLLSIRESLESHRPALAALVGAINRAIGPNVMDFALPNLWAAAYPCERPGMFYWDVLMTALATTGFRDQVVATSALRVLPISSKLPGT